MSVGEKLKEARLKQGITLEMKIDQDTCLFKSLEKADMKRFSEVYAVGFMKRYAKLLKLNDGRWWRSLNRRYTRL